MKKKREMKIKRKKRTEMGMIRIRRIKMEMIRMRMTMINRIKIRMSRIRTKMKKKKSKMRSYLSLDMFNLRNSSSQVYFLKYLASA